MWEPQGFYSKFILDQPVVFMGREAIKGLFNFPGSRFAVIYGSGFSNEMKDVFAKALKAFEVIYIRKSWKNEPTLKDVNGTISELENFNPDVIIAVGGGSVIDGSKICRLLYEFPYFDTESPNFNFLTFKSRFIAVPTTLGSGAEASSAAVLYNETLGKKEMIVNHQLRPQVIVLDDVFIKQSSPKLVYGSSLDAISHLIEGYVSNINNPLSDILAEKGLQLFNEEISKKYDDMDFTRLQYACYLGGVVQNHCIVGAAHAIAHQLTGFGFSHSSAVGLLLKAVISQNSKEKEVSEKYSKLCVNTNIKTVERLFMLLEDLIEKSEYNKARNKLKDVLKEQIANDTFVKNVIDDKGGKGNPVPITENYLKEIVAGL